MYERVTIMNYSKQLKEIRSRLHLSQRELAKMLNISHGHVAHLELAQRKPSLKLRLKIESLWLYKCRFTEPEPLVSFLEPKKKSLFKRFIDWVLKK